MVIGTKRSLIHQYPGRMFFYRMKKKFKYAVFITTLVLRITRTTRYGTHPLGQ